MNTTPPHDQWAAGDAYEAFMGRWSRQLAGRFIDWIGVKPNLAWLDVGCGTGALTSVICNVADPSSVVACDPSEAFVREARRRIRDGRVTVIVAGTDELPQREGGFDRVVSGLVLNFLADPLRSVEGMRARTRHGGMVAAYVWDYAGRMEFLRHFWDEAAALDERARDLDEGIRFPICRRDALEAIFRAAGMRDVMSTAVETPTRFETFDDYWKPFLGGAGPAPSYIASLSEQMLHELRVRLERRLVPGGTGGVIELVAGAWAVRGVTP